MAEHTKSAEQRALDVAGMCGREDDAEFVRYVACRFREHARDQRHLCAESIPNESEPVLVHPSPPQAHADALNAACAAVMNAPEPGKRQ